MSRDFDEAQPGGPRTMRCDSCGAEWWNASRLDVLADGWKFHLGRGGVEFKMCGECERWYAIVRRLRTRPAARVDAEDEAA